MNLDQFIEYGIPIIAFILAIAYVTKEFLINKNGNPNRNIIESSSSIFPTIGILCTFYGIILGFNNFDISDPDKSIDSLINGLKVAFKFSAAGVFISLVCQYIVNNISWKKSEELKKDKISKETSERQELISLIKDLIYEQKINNANQVFQNELGEKLTTKDFFQTSLSNTNEIKGALTVLNNTLVNLKHELKASIISNFEKLHYDDVNGNKMFTGNVLRSLSEQSIKQTRYLGSFSTDLSDSLADILTKKIETNVTPGFENMVEAIQILGSKIGDPATDMTNNVVNDLSAAMKSMMAEFKSSINGNTKDEMEQLAKSLAGAGSALHNFPSTMQDLTNGLNDNFSKLQSVMNELSENMRKQSLESMDTVSNQITEITGRMSEAMSKIQGTTGDLITGQAANTDTSLLLVQEFNETINRVKGLNVEVNESISIFDRIKEDLYATAKSLELTSKNTSGTSEELKNTQNLYLDAAGKIIERNNETLGKVVDSIGYAKDSSENIVMNYQRIDDGLEGIFSKIEVGLKQYSDVISNSMVQYLDKYSQALTETTSQLNGVSQQNADLLDELTDLVKDLKK